MAVGNFGGSREFVILAGDMSAVRYALYSQHSLVWRCERVGDYRARVLKVIYTRDFIVSGEVLREQAASYKGFAWPAQALLFRILQAFRRMPGRLFIMNVEGMSAWLHVRYDKVVIHCYKLLPRTHSSRYVLDQRRSLSVRTMPHKERAEIVAPQVL